MVRIEFYQPADLSTIVSFVGAIQDYERQRSPELRPGAGIASDYANSILGVASDRHGAVLIAKAVDTAVGFACAWIDMDDDPLRCDKARSHAYISDIYVEPAWRQRGVASQLLAEIERIMRERGCRRFRVCSKASNSAALACYETAGFRPYEVIFEKLVT